MQRSIIKIRDMSFKYQEKNIFNNFNLDIYEGSFTTIIGKNSSGKTTLAKLLAGIYKGEGYINIDGYLLNNYFIEKIRRNFSVYIENDIPFDTVRDLLAFSLESLQYTKKEINVLIDKTSKKFKLENVLDKSFKEITASEKIKANIASLLIHKPKIILFDNTLEKLSTNDKKLVLKILRELQKENKLTIILITNNIEDTILADKIIVLDDGKIVLEGRPEELYKDEALEKLGFNLPFIIKLSHNLILYDLLDKVYLTEGEVLNKLWQ